MFCIYKTVPSWIGLIRTLQPDVQVNFWRKNTNRLKLPLGSWFYFSDKGTKNIVGRDILIGYEVMNIEEAWNYYGIGNGVNFLSELQVRAKDVLGVESSGSKIGCILLSELEFLSPENVFVISEESYAPQIVGPKYFEDNELIELQNKFTYTRENQTYSVQQKLKTYSEGEEKEIGSQVARERLSVQSH
jgi:hypothetical protein